MALNTTEELIEDLRQGKMIVVMDDEDRENEGDLIMAADKVTPEAINFMARYGRGLICLTLSKERCQQLRLPLMVSENKEANSTAFTVSIEAAEGVTTGISAADRSTTVAAAVAPDAKPHDLVQPGHIFPLMAQPGGVLVRARHTEAGWDMGRMADCSPAAVIVEILNEDGTMARRPDLEVFAREHNLKMGTIADLIHYRLRKEKTIERVTECNLPTEFGDFRMIAFQDMIDNELHLALVKGEVKPDQPSLVRVHMQNSICDLFSTTHASCGWPLKSAMKKVAEEGQGVIIVLRNHDTPREIAHRITDIQLHDTEEAVPNRQEEGDTVLRTYGVGAQILMDLGVHKMRVMSAPKSMYGLSGFDLEVVEYVERGEA